MVKNSHFSVQCMATNAVMKVYYGGFAKPSNDKPPCYTE